PSRNNSRRRGPFCGSTPRCQVICRSATTRSDIGIAPGRCYLPDPLRIWDGRIRSIRSGLLEVGAWVTLATCGVVSATLDDALAVEERPNMPAMVVVSDT